MHKYIRLNTILIPPADLKSQALELAAKIAKDRETVFSVDDKNYLPHLTLYSPEYPTKNRAKVYQSVAAAVVNTKPIELVFESFYQSWGYVGLGFKKTPEIEDIHKRILEALNPLREGHQREKYTKEVSEGNYPSGQIKYIEQYGYHNILDAYEPHLTIARFKDQTISEKIVDDLKRDLSVPTSFANKLAVSEMGSDGTCTKILKTFEFSRNVAIVVFYDKDLNIIVQERGAHSKLGEKYGFWGGKIEKGESPGEAIKRELIEELKYQPSSLKYWGNYSYHIDIDGQYKGWRIDCHIFIAPVTSELETITPEEGSGLIKMPIDDAIGKKANEFGNYSAGFLKDLKKDLLKSS